MPQVGALHEQETTEEKSRRTPFPCNSFKNPSLVSYLVMPTGATATNPATCSGCSITKGKRKRPILEGERMTDFSFTAF